MLTGKNSGWRLAMTCTGGDGTGQPPRTRGSGPKEEEAFLQTGGDPGYQGREPWVQLVSRSNQNLGGQHRQILLNLLPQPCWPFEPLFLVKCVPISFCLDR